MKHYDEKTIENAKELFKIHNSYRKVANILNIGEESVRRWCNPKAKEAIQQYFKKNKNRLKVYHDQYYLNNKEKENKRSSEYFKKNRTTVMLQRKEHNKIRYHSDVNYKLKHNLRRRILKAIKVNGGEKTKSTMDLIGCSVDFLKTYLEAKFLPGMTWDNHGEWHIDHIWPCSIFDLSDYQEQKFCFHYTNLQPLWAKDNLLKGNKLI